MSSLALAPAGRRARLRARPASTVAAAIAWRSLEEGDSPILPFGRLRGTLLCRHQLRDGRILLLIRELVPQLDERRGRCIWTSGSAVCDLSRPRYDLGDPLSLKPWQTQLLQAADELRQAMSGPLTTHEPVLPFTLMAIPPSTRVLPRPTKAIVQLAEREGTPWPRLWEQIAQARELKTDDRLRWIDTRLCDRVRPGRQWPGAVALAHDLRDVPRGHAWRPSLSASVPESLFIYQPHAVLDGWNASAALMHRLRMEHFPLPMLADREQTQLALAS